MDVKDTSDSANDFAEASEDEWNQVPGIRLGLLLTGNIGGG